jgi:hypothetical protein
MQVEGGTEARTSYSGICVQEPAMFGVKFIEDQESQ